MALRPDQEDQRRFTRIPFRTSVHIDSPAGNWHSELMDVSLKGMLTRRPAGWKSGVGEPATVALRLEGEELAIRIDAQVAHLDDNRIGFTFLHIDLDSLAHLRRLIELNLGNDAQLHRELTAMVQPRQP